MVVYPNDDDDSPYYEPYEGSDKTIKVVEGDNIYVYPNTREGGVYDSEADLYEAQLGDAWDEFHG